MILPQGQVKDLGVFFDKHMNLKSHISSICSSASFALRNIGKIRKHLDRASTERLVHAFVSSRLDNCISLLFGLPLYLIERLQRIQNTAASEGSDTFQYKRTYYTNIKGYYMTSSVSGQDEPNRAL